jgi:hypothetical protein
LGPAKRIRGSGAADPGGASEKDFVLLGDGANCRSGIWRCSLRFFYNSQKQHFLA